MTSWLPEDISTYGHGIDHTIRVIYYIVGAWFVLTEAVLFYFIIRYRKRKTTTATYQPGTTFKALAWILLPAALILVFDLGIDLVQGPVWNEIKIYLPTADQTVRIKGRQFVWEITHPGADGKLETPDDIQILNQLVVPVHKKIQFELQSEDVLHSLWIPNLRLKQDAVPGRTIKGWFEATKEGIYPLACAELCGSGHGTMKGQLQVLNETDYQNWLKENRSLEVGRVE
ncbi:MAG: cytochrome c oxidase subunit II [Deltaproteobacteria bacterium]|nr:cytochrome c oxidase subunit II [Deltaproteobacteria bacterium]